MLVHCWSCVRPSVLKHCFLCPLQVFISNQGFRKGIKKTKKKDIGIPPYGLSHILFTVLHSQRPFLIITWPRKDNCMSVPCLSFRSSFLDLKWLIHWCLQVFRIRIISRVNTSGTFVQWVSGALSVWDCQGSSYSSYILSWIHQSLEVFMWPCLQDRQLLVSQFHLSNLIQLTKLGSPVVRLCSM